MLFLSSATLTAKAEDLPKDKLMSLINAELKIALPNEVISVLKAFWDNPLGITLISFLEGEISEIEKLQEKVDDSLNLLVWYIVVSFNYKYYVQLK